MRPGFKFTLFSASGWLRMGTGRRWLPSHMKLRCALGTSKIGATGTAARTWAEETFMPRLRPIEDHEMTETQRLLIENARRNGAPDPLCASIYVRSEAGR